MAVNWKWKDKMGEVTCKNILGQKFTVNVYQANCLAALVYEENEEHKNYEFWSFFNDIDHLKLCLGLKKDYTGTCENIYKDTFVKWKLNIFFKEALTIAKWIAKAGYPVEIYYKEIR